MKLYLTVDWYKEYDADLQIHVSAPKLKTNNISRRVWTDGTSLGMLNFERGGSADRRLKAALKGQISEEKLERFLQGYECIELDAQVLNSGLGSPVGTGSHTEASPVDFKNPYKSII